MTRLVMLIAAITLAGCETVSRSWVRPDADPRAFYMDQGQCEAQALSSVRGERTVMAFEACMRGRGWMVQETAWVGHSSWTFYDDDYFCSGTTVVPGYWRGQAWEKCMRSKGWAQK